MFQSKIYFRVLAADHDSFKKIEYDIDKLRMTFDWRNNQRPASGREQANWKTLTISGTRSTDPSKNTKYVVSYFIRFCSLLEKVSAALIVIM